MKVNSKQKLNIALIGKFGEFCRETIEGSCRNNLICKGTKCTCEDDKYYQSNGVKCGMHKKLNEILIY